MAVQKKSFHYNSNFHSIYKWFFSNYNSVIYIKNSILFLQSYMLHMYNTGNQNKLWCIEEIKNTKEMLWTKFNIANT